MFRYLILLVVLATDLSLRAEESVHFTQKAVPVSNVTDIGGFFGDRIQKNKDNNLKQFPIDRYVDFVQKQNHKAWDWTQSEQHGKWLESSIFAAAQSGDTALMAKVRNVFAQLASFQEDEGYLGPTAKELRTPGKPLRGMDPYELYYVLHSLITESEQLGDAAGLDAAKKLGDYFVRYIGPGKAEFWPSPIYHYPENVGRELEGQSEIAGHSVHYGWEGTLLIDPMSRLYMKTGDRRYLDWCLWVVGNIDKWSGFAAYSKLDAVAKGKIGVDELQPYVHAHTFQMNFLGFLNLYRITGDSTYLSKVRGAWEDIARRQMYITGGVSVAEHYEKGYIKPLTGNIVETCATMTWMQLTNYLLELTGDVRYADVMERLTWNHVFAAQSADGISCKYHTAPNGTKPNGYFRRPDCCTASGGRILSMMPSFIYAVKDRNVFINQFVSSQVKLSAELGERVILAQQTNYPTSDKIEIVVLESIGSDFSLNVRIPAWCKSPNARLNGKRLDGVCPGTYLSVERRWKKGDRLTLQLPMELEWVEHDHFMKLEQTKLPGGELMYRGIPDQANAPIALMRGPVVYMADNIWLDKNVAGYPENVSKDVVVRRIDHPVYPTFPLKSDQLLLGPAFLIPAKVRGKDAKIVLLPFANVGVWYKDSTDKGNPNAADYSYAIWLNKE